MKALIIILTLIISFSLHAKKKRTAKKKAPSYQVKKINHTNLKTNMKFNDFRVNGKFMFSREAIAKVEDDKNLSDLLGLRTNFKDRLEDLSKRY